MTDERKKKKDQPLTKAREVELGLRKKFHRQLFTKFAKAINTYDLLQEGDKVAVCISGGKDSMLMAKLFQELKKHNKFPFELVFLAMDPGYKEENRRLIEENAAMLEIPITIFSSEIFDAVYGIETVSYTHLDRLQNFPYRWEITYSRGMCSASSMDRRSVSRLPIWKIRTPRPARRLTGSAEGCSRTWIRQRPSSRLPLPCRPVPRKCIRRW